MQLMFGQFAYLPPGGAFLTAKRPSGVRTTDTAPSAVPPARALFREAKLFLLQERTMGFLLATARAARRPFEMPCSFGEVAFMGLTIVESTVRFKVSDYEFNRRAAHFFRPYIVQK